MIWCWGAGTRFCLFQSSFGRKSLFNHWFAGYWRYTFSKFGSEILGKKEIIIKIIGQFSKNPDERFFKIYTLMFSLYSRLLTDQPKNGFNQGTKTQSVLVPWFNASWTWFFFIFWWFFKLWSSIKYGQNLTKNEEKPCVTCPKPISTLHFQNPGFGYPIRPLV